MLKKLPNFPSRKNNQFKMRDIQFVKNQFVSRIPKSLQTCFRAFLEKAFSNPLGKEVVLEQITEKAASVTFIFWNSLSVSTSSIFSSLIEIQVNIY